MLGCGVKENNTYKDELKSTSSKVDPGKQDNASMMMMMMINHR